MMLMIWSMATYMNELSIRSTTGRMPTPATPRRASSGPGDPGLGDRRVADPLRAELIEEAAGGAEHVEAHVLAHDEHAIVAAHLLLHRVVDRLQVTDCWHGGRPRELVPDRDRVRVYVVERRVQARIRAGLGERHRRRNLRGDVVLDLRDTRLVEHAVGDQPR